MPKVRRGRKKERSLVIVTDNRKGAEAQTPNGDSISVFSLSFQSYMLKTYPKVQVQRLKNLKESFLPFD